MSWWPSSWIPTLPAFDFSLPTSIQKRFISFALRQALGHLLKPGQLDIQQVDSQIGSGFVQVRDVELDNDAINSLITGLPIQLHDGSVGKVTVRIPWPNPLTSEIGVSLESLHLTFVVTPTVSKDPRAVPNLAASVASVAESFIHDELDSQEEASLRDSFHPDLPGGLDPFITDDEMRNDTDPPGVSMFASLVEKFLSRFCFDASDIKFTFVYPGHSSFTISIPEVLYRTEVAETESGPVPSSSQASEPQAGVTRTVTISGLTVSTRCLRPPSPQPLSSSSLSTHSSSFALRRAPSANQSSVTASPLYSPALSDSSELDDDTRMLMSQSLVTLPPRAHSPASSVASSMYESAISMASSARRDEVMPPPQSSSSPTAPLFDETGRTTPTFPSFTQPRAVPRSKLGISTKEIEDETLLSAGTESLVLRLLTPPPVRRTMPPQLSPSPASTNPTSENLKTKVRSIREEGPGVIKVEVTLGYVAFALRARHIRNLLDMAQLWASHSPAADAALTEESSYGSRRSLFDTMDASVRIRGVACILLPSNGTPQSTESLTEYFKRPVVPPRLPHGFVRVYLDFINVSCSIRQTPHPPASRTGRPIRSGSTVEMSIMLSDLSAFAFLSDLDGNPQLSAIPILITDPSLPLQYSPVHSHPNLPQSELPSALPIFDVADWTDPVLRTSSAKLSSWRTKAPQGRTPSTAGSPMTSPSNLGSTPPIHHKSSVSPSVSSPSGTSAIASGSQSAISVKFTMTSAYPIGKTSRSRSKAPESSVEASVDVAPLHVFVDLESALGGSQALSVSEAILFLDELSSGGAVAGLPSNDELTGTEDFEDDEGEDDEDTPPGTPHSIAFNLRNQEKEQERERKRLERIVLEDLNLEFDYRPTPQEKMVPGVSKVRSWKKKNRHQPRKENKLDLCIKLPMARIEIRGAPPLSCAPRSGAVVLDIHNLCIFPLGMPQVSREPTARFAESPEATVSQHPDTAVLSAHWERLVLAYAIAGESRASSILSLGQIHPGTEEAVQSDLGIGRQTRNNAPFHLWPHVVVSRSSSKLSTSALKLTTLALSIDVPSVYVKLSKPELDGLQFWADDLSQMIERSTNARLSDTDTEIGDSRDPSLIGSRFFVKTRPKRGSGTDSSSVVSAQKPGANNETVIKVIVHQAGLRLMLPRHTQNASTRPFDLIASDIDVLVELDPEGKEETVLTLSVMDFKVVQTPASGLPVTFIGSTVPRSTFTTLQSLLKVRFTSLVVPGTIAKESRVKVTLCGITGSIHPDFTWLSELASFAKAPPGAFESVVPSEKTKLSIRIVDCSIKTLAPTHRGAFVLHVGDLDFSTVIIGNSPETSLQLGVQGTSVFFVDDVDNVSDDILPMDHLSGLSRRSQASGGVWKAARYALLMELAELDLRFHKRHEADVPSIAVNIERTTIRMHLCADTAGALGAFISDFASSLAGPPDEKPTISRTPGREPTELTTSYAPRSLIASLDEHAFRRRIPEVGPAPDFINDDLPSNLDYLDDSFSATAGLRELPSDDELDGFGSDDHSSEILVQNDQPGVIFKYGGETIRLLNPEGLHLIDNYFETLPPDAADESAQYGDTALKIRAHNCDITVFLYNGYDWERTRRIIAEEAREMRRRLAKIRQLVASGQTPDPSVEETNTLLFNSVYLGLEHNLDELEPADLIAAIDEELNEDLETASQSSWQSFRPKQTAPSSKPGTLSKHSLKKLTRSKGPCIEFRLEQIDAEIDNFQIHPSLASRTLVTVRDVEILDHMKTSTWSKFLTSLRTDSRGNIRETGSNMVRVELRKVYPVPGNPTEEARLRAKILPLRLHVDQDALDFMKKFFSFKDPEAVKQPDANPADEIFFQHVEVFPVDIKLDYKPRRVDYRALRDGRTIELMNFFHFDGSEMTLRHITLTGITGWAKMGDLLNDLWTPDVKATQLVEVISGVAPIRSVVNVGSGVADLVLLPIAQYKKDGRVVRGLQKGTTAFVKSTATEAVKLGARLATGTQVILEQAEHVIGGQFKDSITAEALQISPNNADWDERLLDDTDPDDLISRYADQPTNVKEGVKSAYKSLRRNLNSAAQTILAVPMEVYERSGNEGAVRAVVRAVPIAVLRPMIGASEAVSQTLLGLHNTLDPNVRMDNEAKYKQR